jgi:hypothetical protein
VNAVALEQSYVFRQLSAKSRFGRYDHVDGMLVFVPYIVHYLLELALHGNENRALASLAASALAVFLLRRYFPDGLSPIVRMLLTPRHLSSLPEDRILLPYPGGTSPGGDRAPPLSAQVS